MFYRRRRPAFQAAGQLLDLTLQIRDTRILSRCRTVEGGYLPVQRPVGIVRGVDGACSGSGCRRSFYPCHTVRKQRVLGEVFQRPYFVLPQLLPVYLFINLAFISVHFAHCRIGNRRIETFEHLVAGRLLLRGVEHPQKTAAQGRHRTDGKSGAQVLPCLLFGCLLGLFTGLCRCHNIRSLSRCCLSYR